MGSINYLQAIKPDTAYIKKIIENSLLSVWAIRIEYQSGEQDTEGWQVWGEVLFGLASADPVLAALLSCYTRHPRSQIRINAERFRPQSRMLYTVYNPHFLPAKSDSGLHSRSGQQPRVNEYQPVSIGLRP